MSFFRFQNHIFCLRTNTYLKYRCKRTFTNFIGTFLWVFKSSVNKLRSLLNVRFFTQTWHLFYEHFPQSRPVHQTKPKEIVCGTLVLNLHPSKRCSTRVPRVQPLTTSTLSLPSFRLFTTVSTRPVTTFVNPKLGRPHRDFLMES